MSDYSAPFPVDERSLFTDEELRKALSFLDDQTDLSPSETAQDEAEDPSEAWQLSPDMLDLLALVSEDCALRVAQIRRLPSDAASSIRRAAAIRFGVDI